MNSRIKHRWLTALESGEYKWGLGSLYDPANDCHCALGVLIEIFLDETEEHVHVSKRSPFSVSISINGDFVSPIGLNFDIRDWAGLNISDASSVSLCSDNGDRNYDKAINYIRNNL